MYKYLIVGVTFLILGYAAYYFNTSGGGRMLTLAFEQTLSQGGVTTAQLFSGLYLCESEDGCEHPVTIELIDDTTFQMSYTQQETNEEMLITQGTWGVGNNNTLILLTDKRFSLKDVPSSVHGKIDTIKIRELSKKKVMFPLTKEAVFTRTTSSLSKEEHTTAADPLTDNDTDEDF